jgi:ATP-dependent RNA helicase DBP3
MKIKHLTKSVLEKTESDDDVPSCKKTVSKWIKESDVFEVNGKVVSLKSKKRKSVEDGNDGSDNGSSSDKKAAKKAAKKVKKEKRKSSSSIDAPPASSSGGGTTDIEKWRKEHKIVLKDSRNDATGAERTKSLARDEAYHPYETFDAPACVENINAALIRQCTEVNGFSKPSPIQAQCWPIQLTYCDSKGRHHDVVGIAETGSGKTLAFSMPALSTMAKNKSMSGKRGRSPRMLVLAPTRELAMQSQKVLEEFGKVVDLTSTVIYGGVPKPAQKDVLRKGVDCIVCTPGRLKDLINEGSCDLSQIAHLVLDEADRMLDMGFEEDVRYIIAQCQDKSKRQTAMFSATWPAAIQQLAMEFMIDPICIYVGFESIVGSNGENAVDDSLSANKRVSQTVEVIEDRAREPRLRELLKKYTSGKRRNDRVLVFALYKKEAARLERTLNTWGFGCASIHGDKTQDARNRALSEFKDGSCPILVATDVAARGLDIPDVEVVLNYTFPLTIEDYVHRIGRTGRAGKSGISYTFFQPGDKSHAGELQQVMRQAGQAVPDELMKFGSTIKKKEHKLYGNFGPKGGGPMKKAVKITFDSDGE